METTLNLYVAGLKNIYKYISIKKFIDTEPGLIIRSVTGPHKMN